MYPDHDPVTAEQRKELYKKLGLTPAIVRQYLGRISWRRRTMLEQRGNFDEKYPEDPITAFLVAGNQYFDRELLIARKRELMSFRPHTTFSNGDAVIFWPRITTHRYVIGADVATGRTVSSEDTDYCAAAVLDMEDGEEVAAYRAKVTPVDFAFDLADLGRYYNDALIGPERNMDGATVCLTLAGECGYGNVYKHKDWHKRSRKVIEVEGFPTTPRTRPSALNWLNQHILEHPDLIWDSKFIDEALVFVRNEKGIPAAAQGAHDDRVSARWIAHAVRRAALGWWVPWEGPKEKYVSADQITAAQAAATA